MKIVAKYKPLKPMDQAFALTVVSAQNPKVKKSLIRVAKQVQRAAKSNLLGASPGGAPTNKTSKVHKSTKPSGGGKDISPDASLEMYRAQVAKEIVVLPVEVFVRRKVVPGTPIPVALVGANHWASQAFEFGRGASTTASHFLGAAARSAQGGSSRFRGSFR